MSKKLFGLVFCIILLAGCVRSQPQDDIIPIYTRAAQTVAAKLTANPPVNPPTPLPVTETPVILATTEAPAQTATPTPGNDTAQPDCAQAEFITDLNVPDGTKFAPGAAFTKKWRLKNVGTCAWTAGYKFALVDFKGDPMVPPSRTEIPLTINVAPGDAFDLAVEMTAPAVTGEYTSYWGLLNPAGDRVPIDGGAGGNSFYVEIEVTQSTEGFNVTIDELLVSCQPDKFIITANLTANGAGVVSYIWDNNIFQPPAPAFFTFDAGGTQSITYEIQTSVVASDTAWIDLHIIEPVNISFGHVALKCP